MYIVVESSPGKMPRYICVWGTSQLEGYHKHLALLLKGGNYSASLAGAIVLMFNYRWVIQCWTCPAVCGDKRRDWQLRKRACAFAIVPVFNSAHVL
jgi:hypothetical protein